MDDAFAARLLGRLERLELTPAEAGVRAGLGAGTVERVLDGRAAPPRGKRLIGLAEALSTSVAYLVGLDPDEAVPAEYLVEDQMDMGLLAGDEEALLRAYRRLDLGCRAALLLLVGRMSPEPVMDERAAKVLRRPAK